jgi:hypothetical protein
VHDDAAQPGISEKVAIAKDLEAKVVELKKAGRISTKTPDNRPNRCSQCRATILIAVKSI